MRLVAWVFHGGVQKLVFFCSKAAKLFARKKAAQVRWKTKEDLCSLQLNPTRGIDKPALMYLATIEVVCQLYIRYFALDQSLRCSKMWIQLGAVNCRWEFWLVVSSKGSAPCKGSQTLVLEQEQKTTAFPKTMSKSREFAVNSIPLPIITISPPRTKLTSTAKVNFQTQCDLRCETSSSQNFMPEIFKVYLFKSWLIRHWGSRQNSRTKKNPHNSTSNLRAQMTWSHLTFCCEVPSCRYYFSRNRSSRNVKNDWKRSGQVWW